MGELYAIGGAADRLNDQNKDKQHQPAACKSFLGKPLLQYLFDDLWAREYLAYRLTDRIHQTPVAMMTSHVKESHDKILDLFEKNNWFGRKKDTLFFFPQILVPSFDQEGKWQVDSDQCLVMRPGGHGAIWKLAIENDVFHWLQEQGRKNILVRQINNPIAGIDDGLEVCLGFGLHQNKHFGFISCARLAGSKEGMNVVKKFATNEHVISNVEYCELEKYGISDQPINTKIPYSQYPSNTNILICQY